MGTIRHVMTVGGVVALAVGLKLALPIALASDTAPDSSAAATEASDIDTLMAMTEQNIPAFAQMKTHEPETYNQIRTELAKALQEGKASEDIIRQIRTHLIALYARRLPHAPAELVLETASIAAEQGRILQKADPAGCVAMFNGQVAGDLTRHMPQSLVKQEQQLLGKIIITRPDPAARILSEPEFMEAFGVLISDIAERTDMTEDAVINAISGKASPSEGCAAFTEVFSTAANAPDGNALPFLRYLYKAAAQ